MPIEDVEGFIYYLVHGEMHRRVNIKWVPRYEQGVIIERVPEEKVIFKLESPPEWKAYRDTFESMINGRALLAFYQMERRRTDQNATALSRSQDPDV
jgi:hypothetical protein